MGSTLAKAGLGRTRGSPWTCFSLACAVCFLVYSLQTATPTTLTNPATPFLFGEGEGTAIRSSSPGSIPAPFSSQISSASSSLPHRLTGEDAQEGFHPPLADAGVAAVLLLSPSYKRGNSGSRTLSNVNLGVLEGREVHPHFRSPRFVIKVLTCSLRLGQAMASPTCGSVVAHTGLKIASRNQGLPRGNGRGPFCFRLGLPPTPEEVLSTEGLGGLGPEHGVPEAVLSL